MRAGCSREILPEVAAMKGVEQPPEYHPEGDVWMHTLLLAGKAGPSHGRPWRWEHCCTMSASRRHFAWRSESASTATSRKACAWPTASSTRLRFSREETEQVEALVANHMRFKDVGRMKESTLKRFLRMPDFRRSSRAASAGLPVGQRPSGQLQPGPREAARDSAGAVAAAAAGHRSGLDCRRLRAGSAVLRDPGGGRGGAVGRLDSDRGRGDGAGAAAISALYSNRVTQAPKPPSMSSTDPVI